jgi:4-hydroxy-tetrahydrodipicolinate synthase
LLKGSLVAIVTPMFEAGEIDYASFDKLIEWHIREGTSGIVVVGTSGESPTVSVDEHSQLIERAVSTVNKRIPVIAGTGANSTAESIELASFAQRVGADYSLSVVPYYNKPSQEGLYQHFRKIAESVTMPHILYNVPGRTVADLSNDTALKLSEIDNIVGIKDATGDMARSVDLLRRRPDDFAIYSGDDATFMACMMLGAEGVISVTANVAPSTVQKICEGVLSSNYADAVRLNNSISLLNEVLFVEANPIPVKWALYKMNKIQTGIRLPLSQLSVKFESSVTEALDLAGITH